jgi:hypothetical protein
MSRQNSASLLTRRIQGQGETGSNQSSPSSQPSAQQAFTGGFGFTQARPSMNSAPSYSSERQSDTPATTPGSNVSSPAEVSTHLTNNAYTIAIHFLEVVVPANQASSSRGDPSPARSALEPCQTVDTDCPLAPSIAAGVQGTG